MDILPHLRCTRRFGPPRDWDPAVHGDCGTLQISDVDDNGRPSMESLWRPSSADLETLLAGGALVLRIQGTAHPVVSLGVAGPDQLVGGPASPPPPAIDAPAPATLVPAAGPDPAAIPQEADHG